MKIKCPSCENEFMYHPKTRSNQQNKYYFGVVIDILSNELGYFSDEMHQILKTKFLKINVIESDGETIIITKDTRDLNTSEFEEYLSKIRMWASMKMNIFIPDPNQTEVSYECE